MFINTIINSSMIDIINISLSLSLYIYIYIYMIDINYRGSRARRTISSASARSPATI